MFQSPDRRFWLMTSDAPSGPYTVARIHEMLADGEIHWQVPACAVGGSAWRPIMETPCLGPRPVGADSGTDAHVRPGTGSRDRSFSALEEEARNSRGRLLSISPQLFRILVGANVVLTLLYLGLEFLGGMMFPEDPFVPEQPPSAADGMICLVFAIILPAIIASWIGLWMLRNWGRWLFLGVICLGHVVNLGGSFFDLSAIWHFPEAVGSIAGTTDGILIGIAFFSPLVAEFRKSRRAASFNTEDETPWPDTEF